MTRHLRMHAMQGDQRIPLHRTTRKRRSSTTD